MNLWKDLEDERPKEARLYLCLTQSIILDYHNDIADVDDDDFTYDYALVQFDGSKFIPERS